jgi:hypothetical protein
VLAIDGKAVRGTRQAGAESDPAHGFGLGKGPTIWCWRDARVEDKSNEITAILELLAVLEWTATVATIDAIG